MPGPELLLTTATSLYAGLCTLLLLILGALVSVQRRRHRVGVGTGGHAALELAVRVHANAAENIPLGLMLLLLVELGGAPALAVHAAGILFVAARVSHASGLGSSPGTTRRRLLGMAGTWGIMLVLALTAIVQFSTAALGQGSPL
jgi:uncharacterized membrane protein YecN with MAPEG domain